MRIPVASSPSALSLPIEPAESMPGGSYYEWQDNQKPFVALTSETGTDPCDLNELNPVRLTCARVEHNFLPTLGVTPALGRNFLPAEDRPNAPRVAIISHALWRARFHQDRSVIGKIVRIDEAPTQIVGVLPAGFEMPPSACRHFCPRSARRWRPAKSRILAAPCGPLHASNPRNAAPGHG